MSAPLMKSVSGIRGIIGETLTPDLINDVASAFAEYVKKGKVVIGRDSRCTGEAVSLAVQSTLALAGCDVVDIGIVPTPTVQLMVEELDASGGIVISASHNPIEWNAFKLINANGSFLNAKQVEKFFKMMDGPFKYPKWNKVGKITQDYETALKMHISKVLNVINKNKIKKKNYKVVLDSVNGAGSIITQSLLEELGCTVIPVYCDITGDFPRGAEPIPENITDLSLAVKKHKADIGFAQDPDADRLAVVDSNGKPLGEEYTVALVTEHLLSKESGRVVINLSTTKAIEDIAAAHNSKIKRTKVGEINVVDEMLKKGARIGGEGNGGVISPEIHHGRDSLAGIGYILEMMADRRKSIAELKDDLPFYVMKKGKVKISPDTDNSLILNQVKDEYNSEKLSALDGLRIDFVKDTPFKGGWVHLRPSNTEPVFRIIAEGRDEAQSQKIYSSFVKHFKK